MSHPVFLFQWKLHQQIENVSFQALECRNAMVEQMRRVVNTTFRIDFNCNYKPHMLSMFYAFA